ncbi:MAG: KPN_02809 family neutral zinc metallopeptidase [Actinomycetota bacterium]
MRWRRGGQSEDVEDRRGTSPGGGFGSRIPGGGAGLGLGGVAILLVLSLVFGQNFFAVLDDSGAPTAPAPGMAPPPQAKPADQEDLVDFVSFVLDDVQDMWTREFRRFGREYERAKLVLFTDAVRSGCGFAEAAMGPFYCPLDGKVYVDLGFYRELKQRFGAPGDFAQAYVIAHEVGHHVQNLLGISDKIRQSQQARPDVANALSIRLELQADCLAGMWARSSGERDLLEKGDLEEGLGAAAAVGDDRIQKRTTGQVNPERWTHGSAQQRVAWFKRGLATGRIQDCDTFRTALPGVDDAGRGRPRP